MNDHRSPNYFTAWRRTVDFVGTSTRKEFWVFVLINLLALLVIALVTGFLFGVYAPYDFTERELEELVSVTALGWVLILILPTFTLTLRRVRDATGSGWWLLLGFVPFVGGLIILIVALMPTARR